MSIPLDANPIDLYKEWSALAAKRSDIKEPTAVALATASKSGLPSVRMVLIKEATEQGFVFYTNLGSHKAQDLKENPHASFCQHWMPLERQVRVSGPVEPVSKEEADRYFASRDRMSRIGAWASKQSEVMQSRFDLEKSVAFYTARFATQKLTRPKHWSGFRIIPKEIEFWIAKPFRLHERVLFVKENGKWQGRYLYP